MRDLLERRDVIGTRALQRGERTGRPDADVVMADWNFYLAYNMFRLAGILQGIAKRVEMGTASSAQARQAGAGARPLADMGWALAQQA